MPSGDNKRKITREIAVEALLACDGAILPACRWIGDRYGISISHGTLRWHRNKARESGVEIPDPPYNPAAGQRKPGSINEARRRQAAVEDGWIDEDDARPLTGGRVEPADIERRPIPKRGRVATYILTGAVNNTDIHAGLWRNLVALADYYDAEILVRPILYNLNAYRRLGADTEDVEADGDDIYFDAAVKPFLSKSRIELAPGLHWAGDAPITATAASPLSGYDTFTGIASGIFAATKLEMRSVATMKAEPAKMLYTTGVVTQRNYTETKTGQKADWHHAYGALVVEVDSDGDWFVRHLMAAQDGSFYDLGLEVRAGRVREGARLAALTPGDIHVAQLDEVVRTTLFGPGGMTDQLRPAELHLHDLHDHESRSHHDRRNPFRRIYLKCRGRDSVVEEVRKDADFLQYAARPGMSLVVIGSNHDDHLNRWIAESDWRTDETNAAFYLACAKRWVDAIEGGEEDFHLLEWAVQECGAPGDVTFLRPDQSWKVGDIECGLHGDKGPNGSRGSVRSIAKTGSKSTIGHSHSAGIFEGCWQTGVTAGEFGTMDMGYNLGPSSWSRTLIGTYPNYKRTMITMRGKKWRAERESPANRSWRGCLER